MGKVISTLFSARLISAAASVGVDPRPLFLHVGLAPETTDFPHVDEALHLGLWERIMRKVDDPAFPLVYAETTKIDHYGVLGFACKTAPTLRAALTVAAAHLPAYTDMLVMTIVENESEARVTLAGHGPRTLGRRVSTESTVAEILGAIRSVTGEPIVPSKVLFAHKAPRKQATHRSFFGVMPRFDADADGLVLARKDLARVLPRADPAIFAFVCAELEKLAAAARGAQRERTMSERVAIEITRMLPRAPRAAMVARALGSSVRSLQRRLAAESTSFDEVLSASRRRLADTLLAEGRTTIQEVADATGFADAASFSRAYRRWTSRPPSAARPRPRRA